MIDTCWCGAGNPPDCFKTRYLAAVGQMSSSADTPGENRAILMSSAQLSWSSIGWVQSTFASLTEKKLLWFLYHAGWCAGRSAVLKIFKALWIYLLKLKILSELFPHNYFNGYCSEKGTALKQPNLKFTIYLTPRTFWHLCSKMYCGIDINLTFS